MTVETRFQQAVALLRGEDESRPPWPLEEHWADVLALLERQHHELFDLLAEVVQSVQAARGSLMLLDEPTGELVVRVTYGPAREPQAGPARRLRLGEGVAGTVAADGCPMVIEDAADDDRVSCPGSHLRSLLCVPLVLGGQTVGVLNLCDKPAGFTRTDLALAMHGADAAAARLADSPLFKLTNAPRAGAQLRQTLHDEVQRASRYRRPLCLLAVGLDASHKRKNITVPPADLERIVASTIRNCDFLGRLSADVFGVILPETEAPGARWLAHRIITLGDRQLPARVRVGVSALPTRDLAARAEMALRMAGNGGPRVQLYREN